MASNSSMQHQFALTDTQKLDMSGPDLLEQLRNDVNSSNLMEGTQEEDFSGEGEDEVDDSFVGEETIMG